MFARKPKIPDYLQQHWQLAEMHKRENNHRMFKHWYFEPATKSQLLRLKNEGIKPAIGISKGNASDLIGLSEYLSEEQIEKLRFFNYNINDYQNQTQATMTLRGVFSDPELAKKWNERPPSDTLKLQLWYLDITANTFIDAINKIAEKEDEIFNNDQRHNEWMLFEDISAELFDPDNLDLANIRKPTVKIVIQALDELKEDSISYKEIEDNTDILIDKLLEIRPGLSLGNPLQPQTPETHLDTNQDNRDNTQSIESSLLAASPSKGIAILLALFLGGFGIHKFYTGKPFWGIIYLVFCWTFIPAIIALLEAIGWLLTPEKEFRQKYAPNI